MGKTFRSHCVDASKIVAKKILIVVFLFASQLSVYLIFVAPFVSTWGATEQEALMPMAGDHITPHITSTRAIDIDAQKSVTWRWLMQLGADRGGFFSYYFIEKALGYISRDPDYAEAEFKDFKVGDVVRGSIKEAKAIIPFNFSVLSIETEDSLVLDHWGTFKVVESGEGMSRLIIRSHSPERSSKWHRIYDICFGTPLHYIMERRTLMGIKARVEAGPGASLSAGKDQLWFAGVLLSVPLLLILVFVSGGFSSVLLPLILCTVWIASVFIIEPIPIYSLLLAGSILLAILGTVCYRRGLTSSAISGGV